MIICYTHDCSHLIQHSHPFLYMSKRTNMYIRRIGTELRTHRNKSIILGRKTNTKKTKKESLFRRFFVGINSPRSFDTLACYDYVRSIYSKHGDRFSPYAAIPSTRSALRKHSPYRSRLKSQADRKFGS